LEAVFRINISTYLCSYSAGSAHNVSVSRRASGRSVFGCNQLVGRARRRKLLRSYSYWDIPFITHSLVLIINNNV
uniref:Ovule protein n=1 Tax=Ascaris lumbricoides TaxID=6252 RepID=A0A0M3IX07_ASCLU